MGYNRNNSLPVLLASGCVFVFRFMSKTRFCAVGIEPSTSRTRRQMGSSGNSPSAAKPPTIAMEAIGINMSLTTPTVPNTLLSAWSLGRIARNHCNDFLRPSASATLCGVPEVTCLSTVSELLFWGNIDAPSTTVVTASVAPPRVCRMSTIALNAPTTIFSSKGILEAEGEGAKNSKGPAGLNPTITPAMTPNRGGLITEPIDLFNLLHCRLVVTWIVKSAPLIPLMLAAAADLAFLVWIPCWLAGILLPKSCRPKLHSMGDQPIMKRARYPVALSAAPPGSSASRNTKGRVRELPKAQQDITSCLVPSGGLEGVGMRAEAACGTPVAAAVVPAMAEADLAGLFGCQP